MWRGETEIANLFMQGKPEIGDDVVIMVGSATALRSALMKVVGIATMNGTHWVVSVVPDEAGKAVLRDQEAQRTVDDEEEVLAFTGRAS